MEDVYCIVSVAGFASTRIGDAGPQVAREFWEVAPDPPTAGGREPNNIAPSFNAFVNIVSFFHGNEGEGATPWSPPPRRYAASTARTWNPLGVEIRMPVNRPPTRRRKPDGAKLRWKNTPSRLALKSRTNT